MDYQELRHFADSWGLVFMVVTLAALVGWAFRPGSRAVHDDARQYLNRLSDLLFVLARALNRVADRPDVLWQKGKNA